MKNFIIQFWLFIYSLKYVKELYIVCYNIWHLKALIELQLFIVLVKKSPKIRKKLCKSNFTKPNLIKKLLK